MLKHIPLCVLAGSPSSLFVAGVCMQVCLLCLPCSCVDLVPNGETSLVETYALLLPQDQRIPSQAHQAPPAAAAVVPKPLPVAAGSIATYDETLAAAKGTSVSQGGSQISTITFLFSFFAILFLVSYLIHRHGGPGAVEASVDRLVLRMTGKRLPGSVVDRSGAYSALPR